MDRLILTDEQWRRVSGLIIGRSDQRGSTGRNNRMFVEGVLWIVRTRAPWRDLPEVFGGCFFGASAVGAGKAFGSVSFKPCPMTQISST